MRGILLVSHGFFAEQLKESLKMIAGPVTNVYAACLEPTDGPEQFMEKLKNLDEELSQYDEVVVFADLLGGSPSNTAFQYYIARENYSFIAGMNFPMILTTILSEDLPVPAILEVGKESIIDVREFTKAMMDSDEDE